MESARDMPTILITGANRGLGLTLATHYAQAGWSVIAACRKPQTAMALRALPQVEVTSLDVAAARSIAALARRLEGRSIDVVINNAGVLGRPEKAGRIDTVDFLATVNVNALGPLLVARALLPQLRRGHHKKIIAISSRMGSIATGIDEPGQYAYRCSKAALNMAMATLAFDVGSDGITVATYHPGWIKTDMGGPEAVLDVDASAAALIRSINRLKRSDSGGFFTWDGKSIPW